MADAHWPGANSSSGVPTYANIGSFPGSATNGDLGIALDTNFLYEWNGASWVVIAAPGTGAFIPIAQKAAASGVATLDSNTLIPINQIPPAALERLVIVANQAARYALTTATVQNGDTVLQSDTNVMYFVVDDTNLGNASGYQIYSAGTSTATTTVATTQVSNSASYYPLMVSSSTNSNQACDLGTGLTFNPSTNALTTTTFVGALSGNATTATSATSATSATTATNATNVATTTKSDNVTYYPAFVGANSSANQGVDVGPMTYNPSTSTLAATTFAGALSGNATTSTTATNATNISTTTSSSNTDYYIVGAPANSTSNQGPIVTAIKLNPSTSTVTATNFAGNSTTSTTATNATNVATTTKSDNTTYYPTFVAANSSSNQAVDVGPMTYNPSTGILVAGTHSGTTINPYAAKSTTYPVVTTDQLLTVDASGGSWTLSLYAASGNSGRTLTIKRTDQTLANAVTIDANASETIDGALTTKLTTQYESITLICDGSNWFITDRKTTSIWNTYTPAWTASSSNPAIGNGTITGKWRRIGDSIDISIDITAGSSTTYGSGYYIFSIPSNLTIDTAKLNDTTGNNTENLGTAQAHIGTYYPGIVGYETTSTVTVAGGAGSSRWNPTGPNTFATGSTISLRLTGVPITNWDV